MVGVGSSQYLCYFLGLNVLCHSYIELLTTHKLASIPEELDFL